VPQIANYPGYDFFYYDAFLRRIYFIQVTIVSNPMHHVRTNDNSFQKNGKIRKAIKSWLENFLPDDVEIIELWMIENSYKFKEDNDEIKYSLNAIYFDEIDDLGALKTVSLQFLKKFDIEFDPIFERF